MKNPNAESREPGKVKAMFARVAPAYDKINRAMCFGLDRGWRKILAKTALETGIANAPILDLACGSGDVSAAILRENPDRHVVACDICGEMLGLAKLKIEEEGFDAEIVCADAQNLPFGAEKFGACTVAFGFRNFQNRRAALIEIARVLKPHAPLLVLEVARAKPFIEPMQNFFMEKIAPNIAKFLGGNKDDYIYLAKTTRSFPARSELEKLVKNCGFENISTKSYAFGLVAITKAFKK